MHPVEACANMNDMLVTVGKNRLYAAQGRAMTNDLAERARVLFEKDTGITDYYNHTMAGGKWNHMMDQTHIGYRMWQQPRENSLPRVEEIEIPAAADMGVAVEGSESWWPAEEGEAALPEFDRFGKQSYYIEVFNRGRAPFEYSVSADESWIEVSSENGQVEDETRIEVSVDWDRAPRGTSRVPITISGPGMRNVIVQAVVKNHSEYVTGFVESNGYVSMEAVHYSRAVEDAPVRWRIIPNLGKTLSAVTTYPVTSDSRRPQGTNPRLEYDMHLFSEGTVTVNVYTSPTLNYLNNQGLRYAVSIDDAKPQIVTINDSTSNRVWEEWVRNNVIVTESEHAVDTPGAHVLKIWMVDPGIVFQKIVIETKEIDPGYLGPPESYYRN
jgi:hypothetical protein